MRKFVICKSRCSLDALVRAARDLELLSDEHFSVDGTNDSDTKSQAQKPAALAADRRRYLAEEQVQALAV